MGWPMVQVRAVAASDLGVITGSRDKTVRLWVEKNGTFELDTTLVSKMHKRHQNQVQLTGSGN